LHHCIAFKIGIVNWSSVNFGCSTDNQIIQTIADSNEKDPLRGEA